MPRSTRWLSSALAALTLLPPLLSGCGKAGGTAQPEEAATAPAEDLSQATLVRNTEAQPGDVTRCPISGKPFRVTEDSPTMEYEGKNYVFCCDRCLDEFKKDPAAGVAKLATFEGTSDDAASDEASDGAGDGDASEPHTQDDGAR